MANKETILLWNGSYIVPEITFIYSDDIKGAIIKDDHCYVVVTPRTVDSETRYYPQDHICAEAAKALMRLQLGEDGLEDTIEAVGKFLVKNKSTIRRLIQAAGYIGKVAKKVRRK